MDFSTVIRQSENNHVDTVSTTSIVNIKLKKFLKRENIGKEDAIIDVGCGKGKMVCFFLKSGFGKVAGLEYLEDVYNIAVKNLNLVSNRKKGGSVRFS